MLRDVHLLLHARGVGYAPSTGDELVIELKVARRTIDNDIMTTWCPLYGEMVTRSSGERGAKVVGIPTKSKQHD